MDIEDIILVGVLALVMSSGLALVVLIMIDNSYQTNAKFQACQDLGMEKKTINNFKTCIEPDGTAHITNFQCKGFLWNYDCKVQFIKLQTFGVDING